jgi:hypothetical protein
VWSLVVEAEGGGCDVEPVDEEVAWAGSGFGASSGQYQPGIAWYPEEEDMAGCKAVEVQGEVNAALTSNKACG